MSCCLISSYLILYAIVLYYINFIISYHIMYVYIYTHMYIYIYIYIYIRVHYDVYIIWSRLSAVRSPNELGPTHRGGRDEPYLCTSLCIYIYNRACVPCTLVPISLYHPFIQLSPRRRAVSCASRQSDQLPERGVHWLVEHLNGSLECDLEVLRSLDLLIHWNHKVAFSSGLVMKVCTLIIDG